MAKKAGTRIKSYYGIPIPPWPRPPRRRHVTLVFVLQGQIPSQKNRLISVVDRSEALRLVPKKKKIYTREEVLELLYKTFSKIVNDKDYKEWQESTVEIFKQQLALQQPMAEKKGITFPLSEASIKIRFYWKGKYRRDNSNKSEGIHDALWKAIVINDDCYQTLNPTQAKAGNFTTEIVQNLAVIYLTTPV